jgi:hypothetical protein
VTYCEAKAETNVPAHTIHARGILERALDRLRGREQMLVRAGDDLPLLLLSFPSGAREVAREIEAAYSHTLRRLSPEARAPYGELFAALPAMVVVLLRPLNPCLCLGHHHPPGTESRLTRRLEADLGGPIGELDLAYEGIRDWRPEPLSTLAAGDLGGRWPAIHFQAAALAVLLHELEHLVFPARTEQETRLRSNRFYSTAMRELVAEESGTDYGMASPPPRP